MNLRNLGTRTIAGIVYVALVLLGILVNKILFAIIFSVFLGLALYEFYKLADNNIMNRLSKVFNIVAGILVFVSTIYYENIYTAGFLFLLYLIFIITTTVFDKNENQLKRTITSIFGQVYITIPLLLLSTLVIAKNEQIIFSIFVLIWINDTAAYLVGSMFGKHKLLERISPKKTIEGFIGGIVFTVAAGLLLAKIAPSIFSNSISFNSAFIVDYNYLYWALFAFIVSVFGTIGDLFESLIKRTYSVKDSGKIIPGHGGILDRIDSVLLAIPAIYFFHILIS